VASRGCESYREGLIIMAEIETRQQLIKHLIRAAQRMVFEERDSRYIETAIETYLNKHQ
jgi:hypothetical protein